MNNTDADPAKRLVILGLLLQVLHVLFGITALMGMFINHMMIDKSKNTVYYSHVRWQLITFWVCAALYVLAGAIWFYTGALWPAVCVLLFSFYRIAVSAYYCFYEQPIKRLV